MKNKIILLSIMISAFVFISNAQVRQITSSEFYNTSRKSYTLMSERPHRRINKSETFENGVAVSSIIETKEQITPYRFRLLTIEKKGSDEKISESIRIDDTFYKRENNGQWTISKLSNGSGFGSTSATCSQFTAEDTSINGFSALKLSSLIIASEEKGLTFYNESVWYDPQGFILRSETGSGLLEPRVEIRRSVTTYEYDLKDLKIEAPVK